MKYVETVEANKNFEFLDSWYGRLSDIEEDLVEHEYEILESNREYIVVAPCDSDAQYKLTLGGARNTITITNIECILQESSHRAAKLSDAVIDMLIDIDNNYGLFNHQEAIKAVYTSEDYEQLAKYADVWDRVVTDEATPEERSEFEEEIIFKIDAIQKRARNQLNESTLTELDDDKLVDKHGNTYEIPKTGMSPEVLVDAFKCAYNYDTHNVEVFNSDGKVIHSQELDARDWLESPSYWASFIVENLLSDVTDADSQNKPDAATEDTAKQCRILIVNKVPQGNYYYEHANEQIEEFNSSNKKLSLQVYEDSVDNDIEDILENGLYEYVCDLDFKHLLDNLLNAGTPVVITADDVVADIKTPA